MSISIQPFRPSELGAILAMNNAAVPAVNQLSEQEMARLGSVARYFRTAHYRGELAGFLLALDPQADYSSANFQWFRDRYDAFLYIDRVVVAEASRRTGVGRVLYADVQSYAEQRFPFLNCEVNLEPRNDVSLLFHATIGFQEVGVQTLDNGKTVSLLSKPLSCFKYVDERRRAEANAD